MRFCIEDCGFDIQQSRARFDAIARERAHRPRRSFHLGLFEAGQFCGLATLSLRAISKRAAAFELRLAASHCGRYGLAVDAASALIDYGFTDLRLAAITGACRRARVVQVGVMFGAAVHAQNAGVAEWTITPDTWRAAPARRRLLQLA